MKIAASAVACVLVLVLPVAATASKSTTYFRGPGKIYCLVSKAGGPQARCDAKQRSFSVPPRPSSCIDHDWGIGALVTGKASDYVCTGQPLWLNPSPGEILPVGMSVQVGQALCKSLKTGIRCVHTPSGHGFKISQQKLKLF